MIQRATRQMSSRLPKLKCAADVEKRHRETARRRHWCPNGSYAREVALAVGVGVGAGGA
jgi:hypothetical protein